MISLVFMMFVSAFLQGKCEISVVIEKKSVRQPDQRRVYLILEGEKKIPEQF